MLILSLETLHLSSNLQHFLPTLSMQNWSKDKNLQSRSAYNLASFPMTTGKPPAPYWGVTLALSTRSRPLSPPPQPLLSSPSLQNTNLPLPVGAFPSVYRYVISPILKPLLNALFPTTMQISKNFLEKSCICCLWFLSFCAPLNPCQWHLTP